MSSYIDRELVLDTIDIQNNRIWNKVYNLPVADVAPVRHGKWIREINHTYIPIEYDDYGMPILHECISFRCSLCGREEAKEEPYCHCGALMDKKEDD